MAARRAAVRPATIACCLMLLAASTYITANAAEPAQNASQPSATDQRVLEEVTVSSTPLGGLEVPTDRVPGNVQRATSENIEHVRRASLAQFMDQRLGSVFINEAQANPLQPDVQFRGFVASPLLGQPQGIAVYQDGVRINDPFGDVVSWALVPEAAIASVDLIPGSNPVFGLNALGGALSLRTKDGFSNPGTGAEAMHGSFGRTIAKAESGGQLAQHFSYFGSARFLTEDGWREHSPSDARHLFADFGWRDARSSANLNLTRVEADLIGNGPAPVQLLQIDRDAIYTYPDRTENSLTFLTLSASRHLTDDWELHGVAYTRRSNIDSLNGDESALDACEMQPAFTCNPEGELAHDTQGQPIAFSPAVDGALLNRGSTRQQTNGLSLQLGSTGSIGGRDNRFIVGGSLDRSHVRFDSSSEAGRFDGTRRAIGSGIVLGESLVDLDTRVANRGVFVTDTFAITPEVDLIVAGRYNDTRIELRDGVGTALNGDHRFTHFNPAAGLTYRPVPGLSLYASYSESNRAPSPVELTCADRNDPCALPNAFLTDPPLEQVIATTYEVGARGNWRSTRWHAGLFRTTNQNDILFVSAGALTNHGFFDNAGTTRRQGLELNLSGALFGERVSWSASYTQLQAEFRDYLRVMSPHNPAAQNGEIEVLPGARIPGIPERVLKANAHVRVTDALAVDLDVAYQSDQYLRGDEANVATPLAGYTVLNASLEWQLSHGFAVFAQLENLLDARYETFGLFGTAQGVLGESFDDPRFVSPGAPRSAWVGFRWEL